MSETPLSSSSASASAHGASRSRSSGVSRQAITPVLQFWKAFDLDSKRLVLDTQGNAMKTEKESSLKSRKKLAETTKGFRKLPDSDKIAAVGGLLRAYQEEIDSLTKRAKFAENAFFMLYKGLYAAPDPVPSLEAAAADTKLSELEETNRKLARELQDYEAEFATLTNQDITIRTLEARVSAFENEMDTLVHTRVDAQCRELDAQLAAKDLELTQQRLDYERQLESSRSDLRDAFRRLDAMQSDLFAHKQQRSGAAPSVLDRDLFADDALVTQTLQLENAQLKQQLDALLSVGTAAAAESSVTSAEAQGASSAGSPSAFSELADRDATIQSLRHDVFRLQDALATAQTAATRERERLDDALAQAQVTVEDLARELAVRPTVETHNDVLHQLHVLQQLEYNIVDDDDDAALESRSRALSTGETADSAAHGSSTRTEKILVSRVRRLEHALQQSELSVQATRAELAEARDDAMRKSAVVDEQRVLLRNLEEHVATLESRKRAALHPVDVGTEILLDAVDASETAGAGPSATGPLVPGAGVAATDTKMLEIVRGQRDRFRERMKELESEKRRLEDLAASLKASVTRLENDNMQLYHKIRYLQSYRSGASSSSSGHRVTPSLSMTQLEAGAGGASADVEAKYRGLYEEKLNPFVQFNRMETQQRYANLNTVDKVLLNSAKMFLGHRVTRNIAFGYIVLLHFLVFATLYSFMHGCGISNE